MDSHFIELIDLIDDISQNITDKQYKDIVELIAKIRKKKIEKDFVRNFLEIIRVVQVVDDDESTDPDPGDPFYSP